MKNVRSAMCDVRCGRRRFYRAMAIGGSLLAVLAAMATWPILIAALGFAVFAAMTLAVFASADDLYGPAKSRPRDIEYLKPRPRNH